MAKSTETVEIKLEFLSKDKAAVYSALMDIEELAKQKKDIPFSTYKRLVKPLIFSEVFRQRQKDTKAKTQYQLAIASIGKINGINEKLKVSLVEYVFSRLSRLNVTPKTNYKECVADSVCDFLHYHKKLKKLPDYKLTHICGEILESIDMKILPKNTITKRADGFNRKLLHEIKKARQKIGNYTSPDLLF